ncbi:ABC transporter permease [Chitinophaga arvensicola]|uniref:FtsX-like permease family protein n=1 Tax=Chitinophaga arvensicola TaxID=29529 RepID=A0A1I0SDA8_9BACT|nr:ABC transporter permease [Chitinophaga arvensicola]SEW55853.1 FtsX-like permease family protein [Chitinophaga arvensicola]
MFGNYFKIAWRNLIRNKAFSVINILGLTIGLVCSLLIFLWVADERSIDNFHQQGSQLYLVYERQILTDKTIGGYKTPGMLAGEMKRAIPEIVKASNFAWIDDTPDRLTFEEGNKIIKFDACYADADYFQMMSYPLLKGTAATALSAPGSLCISNKMAAAFFGSADAAIGKTLRCDNRKDFTITGVFKDLPDNVSAKFDCLIDWTSFLEDNSWAKEWGNVGPNTLVLLRKDANPAQVEAKIKNFLAKYNTDHHKVELGLQPFGESYLNGDFKDGYISGGRIAYIRLFSIVAIFIVLIACINFMNLTTARSAKRAKEIGIRKVAGAARAVLMRQFLSEAILMTVLSVCLALVLVYALLPLFNQLSNKQLVFPLFNIYFWISLAGLTLATGLAAGSYPAIFLSSLKPVKVLKGALKSGSNDIRLRKGLVVFQFVLSILFITSTIIVSRQVKYIQQTNLGYDRENLIYVPVEGNLASKYEVFKQSALNAPGIKGISRIGEPPTAVGSRTWGVEWEGKTPDNNPLFTQTAIGYDFVKTLHLKLVAGRDFSLDFASDSAGYLINEAALKVIGYKDPIGKPLTLWGRKGRIVGVLKDFHFSSLHDAIVPLILHNGEQNDYGHILVRTVSGQTKQALASLGEICKTLNPKFPFTYSFSDDAYRNLYNSEAVVNKLSTCFSFLAIFISCLGLLGLAMFTAEQRKKEIGIRKVLGAGMVSLFTLLTKEFVFLILIAFLIASPFTWWLMHTWLQTFAYKIHMEWWMFAVAVLLIIGVAMLTISYQSIRAILMNPVRSLKGE